MIFAMVSNMTYNITGIIIIYCKLYVYIIIFVSALTFQYGLSLYKNVIHLADIVISQVN